MVQLPSSAEVIIVGAGPTGLALAAGLCRHGVRPLLIDRQAAGSNTSRAAVVHARTLEVLEAIGATEALLARGLEVATFRVRDRNRLLATLDFSTLPSRYPFALMCSQSETERVLAERLAALGGAAVRNVEVAGAGQDTDGAWVEVGGERPARIAARFLVGCDGMHSTVRQAAGIDFAGAAYAASFVLADVRLDWALPPTEVNLLLSPAGLVVVAPLPGGHHRIVATVDDAPADPPLALFQQLMEERGPADRPARLTDLLWSSRFRVHHRVAATMRRGRILLAGDAAHVHSPAGGQGMNTGIQDAVALAEPLAAVLAGAPEAVLDAWAAGRHAVATGVVRMTDRMTRLGILRNPLARLARNEILAAAVRLPVVRRAIAMRLSELNLRGSGGA